MYVNEFVEDVLSVRRRSNYSMEVIYRPQEISAKKVAAKLLLL